MSLSLKPVSFLPRLPTAGFCIMVEVLFPQNSREMSAPIMVHKCQGSKELNTTREQPQHSKMTYQYHSFLVLWVGFFGNRCFVPFPRVPLQDKSSVAPCDKNAPFLVSVPYSCYFHFPNKLFPLQSFSQGQFLEEPMIGYMWFKDYALRSTGWRVNSFLFFAGAGTGD